MNEITIDMLLEVYNDLSKKMSSHRIQALADHLRESDLTLNQYFILNVIQLNGPCLSIYLAQMLKLKAASITYLVDSLEKKGLVKRVDNPEDRRSHHICLTDEGISVISFPIDNTALAQFFEKMDNEEVEMLYFMMRLLKKKLTTIA